MYQRPDEIKKVGAAINKLAKELGTEKRKAALHRSALDTHVGNLTQIAARLVELQNEYDRLNKEK